MPSRKDKRVPSKFSVEKAHAAQRLMSKQLLQCSPSTDIRYVAGTDVAYTERFSIGAVTLLDYKSLSIVESQTAAVPTRFPYVPTLLAFREIPPLVAALSTLRLKPDVVLVDGHGIMHPCRFGLACHFGLLVGKPTIGVAKRPMIGEVGRFNGRDWAPIVEGNEVIGVALATAKKAKPIYVSVGHLVSLKKAMEIVKHCTPTERIPKPLRSAHNLAVETKRKTQSVLLTT
ncbi:MAG: endonuclease V [Candidatus Bathyarchaeota archaeon]|nr:endonuclease V [Candidatus Bathyarchaeota archaeon]